VESYLPSVVGGEMPASWPQAALRAQAVAARTYALRQRKPSAPFDLKATVASQVYKGIEAETPSTRQAVASTRSQVLMHGNGLINAVFHSSSGGNTENSGEIWTTQLPYLVSVPDFDDSSPVRDWKKQFTPWQLRKAFPETGGVRRIDVLSTTATGRIRQARVVGPRGSLVLKGSELRSRLKLRSTLAQFVFDGAGETALQGGPEPTTADPADGGELHGHHHGAEFHGWTVQGRIVPAQRCELLGPQLPERPAGCRGLLFQRDPRRIGTGLRDPPHRGSGGRRPRHPGEAPIHPCW
jgi:SpoIID/LytB domain protein